MLDEFSALASGVDSAINLIERLRDVGVQVVVAAQSVEGHRRSPSGPAAAGLLRRRGGRAAVPRPGAAAGPGWPGAGAGAQLGLDYYGPRGFAKARMGERPRIDPEQVRQAQPGEAWVVQAGQSIHLHVLPPPAVAPEPIELAATLPLADDTLPLPKVEEPAPVGIAAAVALAGRSVRRAGQHLGRRRERIGRLPTPAHGPWLPAPPLPGGAGDEATLRPHYPAVRAATAQAGCVPAASS